MNEENQSPINIIRSAKRQDLKDLRNKHKEAMLCNKRLRLNEVSKYINDVNPSEFKELVLKLKFKSASLEVIRKIKNSCVNVKNIEAFFRINEAMDSVMRIIIGKDAVKQIEAVACLTNLACGPHKCCYKVAKTAGAYLVSFINGNSYCLQDQSAWAAANIANDCFTCFKMIKSQGILPALFNIIQLPVPSVMQSVVFALNVCTRYNDTEVVSLIQAGLPNHLFCFLDLNNFNRSIFLDAAFTLSNCYYLSIKHSLEVFDVDAAELLIATLANVTHNPEIDILVATPLIRCLGFLSCNDKICEYISEQSDFQKSIQVIMSVRQYAHLQKEAIWVLTNITAHTSLPHICLISLMDDLKLFMNSEARTIFQVLYFLSSLASASESFNLSLKQHEIYSNIKCLLESEQKDIKEAATVFIEITEHQ